MSGDEQSHLEVILDPHVKSQLAKVLFWAS